MSWWSASVQRAVMAATLLGVMMVARSAEPQALPPMPAAQLDATPIREAIAQLAGDVHRWGGALGVHVTDMATGRALAALEEHQPLNPASNAKLWTTAAALRVLGGKHRFLTGLYGSIEGDRVDELVLRGDGDPSLRSADLWAMAAELKGTGVRRVHSLTVDQGFFDDSYVPPAFEQQPWEWAAFRAPIAPVSLNGNTVVFSVRPRKAGSEAWVEVDPPGFVDLTGSVETSKKDGAEKVQVGLAPLGSRLSARLGGHVPEGGRVTRVARRVDDPRLLAGFALRSMLKQVGIEVHGDPKLGGAHQRTLLVAHRSATVAELVGALGKDSDNFYAEMLFKAIGAKAKGRPAAALAASEAVRDFLVGLGAFEAGCVVKNGSGLFDANRMTASSATTLLRAMAQDPAAGPEFASQLSVGGVDGTLRHRFREWSATHAVRAKTGTLDAVAALSGYVAAPPGRSGLAFSILVNGIPGKVGAARPGMDRVVDAAVREVWKGTAP